MLQKIIHNKITYLSLVAISAFALLVLHSQSSGWAFPQAVKRIRPQHYDSRIGRGDKHYDLTVEDNKLLNGPSDITVHKGDVVRVDIKAVGEEAKLWLTGYDIITESDGQGNAPGAFSFIADTTGSFPFYALGETSGNQEDFSAPQYYLGTIDVK